MAKRISDAIKELKARNYNFDVNVCPNEITFEMLAEEMYSSDLNIYTAKDKNFLWKSYCIVMFTNNPFGFYMDEQEKVSNEDIIIPYVTIKETYKK